MLNRVLLICVCASVYTFGSAQSDRAASATPNVLFIIADDLNVALGDYADSAPRGNYATAKTPNLDRLAAEGIRFDWAYVQNPLCNPSRTSLLSGLRPPSTDVYDGRTEPRHKIGDVALLPEHFHNHGYFTESNESSTICRSTREFDNLARNPAQTARVAEFAAKLKVGWRAALPPGIEAPAG